MTRQIAGLGEIAGGFDAFLLDQFGVLHDGERAFPGAVDCATRLRALGRPVALISNSGRRAGPNIARLAKLGFAPALFDAVVTSGEACRDRLAAMLADGRLAPGAPVWLVAREGDLSVIEGLPLTRAGSPETAVLALIAGRDADRRRFEEDAADLAPLARLGVPCLCANPDLTMYSAGGAAPGPGALAKAYAAAGGRVTMFGKPDPALFRAALARLGPFDPARVLVVGDSPAHDVAGAKAAGFAALLVEGGVQGGETGEAADYAAPGFVW
ncbi:MAG: TIGR01459 family HAD-type hydrolase [Rhodobacteraceae bacterium]|nr:MAG: TIGR01459 family HAD-type hydrolase [Paracoccaceae bacterium]